MQDYKTEYQRWLNSSAIDEKTRAELLSVKDNEKEQEDRFYTELEFGTAGLRGILGAGTNRMNVYVVRRATAGLAAVISKISPALAARGVAIAYDSRRCSKEFAYEAARTLAVCGIRSFVFSSIHSVPQLSFAVRELWCAAGIVITASHNPPQYNGYKVYWSHGGQVGPELAEKIFESIRRADYFDIDTSSLASVNESQMICTVSDLVDEAYYKKALSLRLNPELMQERGANYRVVYTPLHGAGLVPVTEILKRAGLKKLRVVEEQAQPDGDFPTVAAPNPEDPNAFTLALQLAKKTDAQLLLATDPDSDRLGVICRSKGGKYRPLTGNQIGCLLIYYILTMRRERGELPDDAFVVKSLVSTGLADAICTSFGVEMRTVPTGFRFIAEQIDLAAKQHKGTFMFGFEESYGFLAGDFVHDKDAISTALLVCEAAIYCESKGSTLWNMLQEIYAKFGCYFEKTKSYTLAGREGMERICRAMSDLRSKTPQQFGAHKVKVFEDYSNGTTKDFEFNLSFAAQLPQCNVLRFTFSEGGNSSVIVRPSGTEPKLKLYISASAKKPEEAEQKANELLSAANAFIEESIKS